MKLDGKTITKTDKIKVSKQVEAISFQNADILSCEVEWKRRDQGRRREAGESECEMIVEMGGKARKYGLAEDKRKEN
jgi:hypothetical protein